MAVPHPRAEEFLHNGVSPSSVNSDKGVRRNPQVHLVSHMNQPRKAYQ